MNILSFSAKKIGSLILRLLFSFSLFLIASNGFLVSLAKLSLIIFMNFSKFSVVELWSLKDFDFSHSNVSNWIDGINFLCNFLFNCFTGKKTEKFGSISIGNLFVDDFINSSSNLFLLRSQSIVCFLLLSLGFSGECNNKYSNNISILGFTVLYGLDQCFSFFYQRRKLISSHINTIETCKSISASCFINNKFDFSPSESILIRSKISLISCYNSTSNTIFNFL